MVKAKLMKIPSCLVTHPQKRLHFFFFFFNVVYVCAHVCAFMCVNIGMLMLWHVYRTTEDNTGCWA